MLNHFESYNITKTNEINNFANIYKTVNKYLSLMHIYEYNNLVKCFKCAEHAFGFADYMLKLGVDNQEKEKTLTTEVKFRIYGLLLWTLIIILK